MKKILSYMGAAVVLVGFIQPNFPPSAPVASTESVQISNVPVEEKPKMVVTEVIAEPAEEAEPVVNQEPAPEPTPEPTPAPVVNDNETIIWDYLIGQGFTREQTAGIMGNLQQEHNFQTSDAAGGLGIAQWIGFRRERLIAAGDYLNLNTQLDFLMRELNTSEIAAHRSIKAATTVEQSTVAFQDLFERCGVCMESQRIQYAYAILGRH